MKFCAVICEYNPFHRGHLYQFEQIRKAGYEHILCIMSGNFTQRGEAAVFDKYTRARHAVGCGADAVLELPVPFAVSSAELFAGGAVHILAALENVQALAFGCESGTKESFMAAAKALHSEDKVFKNKLKQYLKDGHSYICARNAAFFETHGDVDEALLSYPNNILGTEYCRALLLEKSAIDPLPILRVGGGYADTALLRDFSSAGALRAAMKDLKRNKRLIKANVPAPVWKDILSYRTNAYHQAAMCALLSADPESLSAVPDCSEGLENRLISMAKTNPDFETLISKVVTKRYTASRLRRIVLQNFLGVTKKEVKDYLTSPLYARVLAVRKDSAEEILSSLSPLPVIARKGDAETLKKDALACFSRDVRATELYSALTGVHCNPYLTLFV